MELKGEYRIAAPREHVWAMLNDAAVLRECIPGCEALEGNPADGFSARVTTKIGPVKATFNGEVTLSNVNPPESYTISGEGKGGVAGFAKGGADVHLAEDGAGTVLTYVANAQVGGKLAQLGSRLIDSTSKKLADQFFAAFAAKAGAPVGAAALSRRGHRPARRHGCRSSRAGARPRRFRRAEPAALASAHDPGSRARGRGGGRGAGRHGLPRRPDGMGSAGDSRRCFSSMSLQREAARPAKSAC